MIPQPLTSSLTADQSLTVLSRINSGRQKGALCGRKDFHGTMDILMISCLSSVQFCYFFSRLFFKIWNDLPSLQQNVDFSVSNFSSVFIFLNPFYYFNIFFNRKQWETVHRPAKEAGCIFFLLEKSFGLTEKVATGAAYFKLLQKKYFNTLSNFRPWWLKFLYFLDVKKFRCKKKSVHNRKEYSFIMQIMKNYLYTEHDFFNALLFPLKNLNQRIMQVKKNLKNKSHSWSSSQYGLTLVKTFE